MKRIVFFALLALLLVPSTLLAVPSWNRGISIEWGYEPPADVILSGFKLYQEGVPVCEFGTPTLRSGACEVILTKRTTPFTLTAAFIDGTESPHSEAYNFVNNGPGPKIIFIIITPR